MLPSIFQCTWCVQNTWTRANRCKQANGNDCQFVYVGTHALCLIHSLIPYYWFSELKNVCKQSTRKHFFFGYMRCSFFFFIILFIERCQCLGAACLRTIRLNIENKLTNTHTNEYSSIHSHVDVKPNWILPSTQINLFTFENQQRDKILQHLLFFAKRYFSPVRKFIFSPHLTFRVNAFIQTVCSHQLPIGV